MTFTLNPTMKLPVDLNRKILECDQIVDRSIAALIGEWDLHDINNNTNQWANLKTISQFLQADLTNSSLWNGEITPKADNFNYRDFSSLLREISILPPWANRQSLSRAGEIFRTHGSLCSVILFCSSLPEVYSYKSITAVLQTSNQLRGNASARIKSTANLILPIMKKGGLTEGAASGIVGIIKARIIHSLVRNLILRGNPEAAMANNKIISTITLPTPPANHYVSMFCHGWDFEIHGAPCNQYEQEYVILCFSFVLLRGLRYFGVHLNRTDEAAFIHAWNVIAYLMGISNPILFKNYDEGREIFKSYKQENRLIHDTPELESLRFAHMNSLISTMGSVIKRSFLKDFPVILAKELSDEETQHTLGILRQTTRKDSVVLFHSIFATAKRYDSFCRLLGRKGAAVENAVDIIGDKFIEEILELDINELRELSGKSKPGLILNTLAKFC